MKSPLPVLVLIAVIAVYYMFRFDYWKRGYIIRSDGFAYYGYVQGTLVHHDPLNTFHGKLSDAEKHRSWMHEGLPGKYLPKMTYGLALAWVPGFYIAHAAAALLNQPMDGWSMPYQLAVGFTGIAFLIMGCAALWYLLSPRFKPIVASIVVIVVFAATNLLQYSSVDNSMSHVYSFALVAIFLLLIDRWVKHEKPGYLWSAALIFGWIVLIRPTNIIVGLFPLGLIHSADGNLKRLWHPRLVVAGVLALLPLVPQLIFWKLSTGEWLHYSYENEAFYWLDPKILQGLFSYRNGWLLYTPVMVFALFGMYFLKRINKSLFYPGLLITMLHIYITFSWWCWYYGGSLSIRPMIDIYPILAFGLAALVHRVLQLHKAVWLSMSVIFGVLIWNNIIQTRLANEGVITDSSMTKKAFWATFMNPHPPHHLHLTDSYRDPDTDRLRKGLPERTSFDTLYLPEADSIDLVQSKGGAVLSPERTYSQILSIPASRLSAQPGVQLKVTMEMACDDYDAADLLAVISFQHRETNFQYQTAECSMLGLKEGIKQEASLYVRKPAHMPDEGEMQVYAWFRGKGQASVYNIKVQAIKVDYSETQ